MCETVDTLIGIVHCHGDTFPLEIVDWHFDGFTSILGCECQGEFTWSWSDVVCGSVLCLVSTFQNVDKTHLISESVSTYADGLSPTWHWFWDFLKDDRFSEDCTAEDISDLMSAEFREIKIIASSDKSRNQTHRSIWTSPHFLQLEFFDSSLVRSDGSAFHTDRVFLDSFGTINSDLIVCLWVRCALYTLSLNLQHLAIPYRGRSI